MHTTELPHVRAHGPACDGECAGCGANQFQTEHGSGSVSWWGGVGSALRFGDPAQGERIHHPVRCARCGLEHAPLIELPPLVGEPVQPRLSR
jgi:hypothetical protein